MNIVALLDEQAEQYGERVAIYHGKNKITYWQLAEESCRGSAFLQNLGLVEGDVVLVFVPMSIDLYLILMSLWRYGLVAMFLDPASGRVNIKNCISRVKPKAFIGITKAQLMRIFMVSLRAIPISISTASISLQPKWSARKKFEAKNHLIHCSAESPALITFTSGSTGIPKGAVRTHGFLIAQKEVLQNTLSLQPGNCDVATLAIFALINLACGVTTIIPSVSLKLPGKVNAGPILADIDRYQPQTAVGSPAFFDRLRKDKNCSKLSCLKAIFTGGAPVFPQLLEKLAKTMPQTRITAVYGSTEAEPIAELVYDQIKSTDLVKMAEGEGLLAGHVVKQIECCILEDKWGNPLETMTKHEFHKYQMEPSIPGEIVVNGKHVLKGYLGGIGDRENKFTVENKVWHRTGDLGYFDETGRLWLLGRCSAKIYDAKGTVYPFAVETAVMQVQDIKRAALCQMKNKRILVIETSESLQIIKNKLKKLLTKFQIDSVINQTIPVDKRHNAKVDYQTLAKTIKMAS